MMMQQLSWSVGLIPSLPKKTRLFSLHLCFKFSLVPVAIGILLMPVSVDIIMIRCTSYPPFIRGHYSNENIIHSVTLNGLSCALLSPATVNHPPHLDIYSIIPSSTRRSSRIIAEYPLHCMMIKMKLMIKGFVNESNDHHIHSKRSGESSKESELYN